MNKQQLYLGGIAIVLSQISNLRRASAVLVDFIYDTRILYENGDRDANTAGRQSFIAGPPSK